MRCEGVGSLTSGLPHNLGALGARSLSEQCQSPWILHCPHSLGTSAIFCPSASVPRRDGPSLAMPWLCHENHLQAKTYPQGTREGKRSGERLRLAWVWGGDPEFRLPSHSPAPGPTCSLAALNMGSWMSVYMRRRALYPPGMLSRLLRARSWFRIISCIMAGFRASSIVWGKRERERMALEPGAHQA